MSEPTAFTGTVKDGKFIAEDAKAFKLAFAHHEGRRVVLWVKRFMKIRSTGKDGGPDANGYYWGVVVYFWGRELGMDDPKQVHEVLKTMYHFKPILVGEEVLRVPLSTAGMESGPFWAFVERCRVGFGETYPGGQIPSPGEGVSQMLMAEYESLGNAKQKEAA